MSDFFSNVTLFCLGFLMLLGLLYSMMSFIKFAQNIIDDIEDKKRFSFDSKDFKIGDPVAYSHLYQNGSRFSYISGFDSSYGHFCLETDDWYSLDQIRHPTKEELEKYFRK